MREFAADDFDEIRKHQRTIALGGRCARNVPGYSLAECWCIGAGPNGGNLPCPPEEVATDFGFPTEEEKVEKAGAEVTGAPPPACAYPVEWLISPGYLRVYLRMARFSMEPSRFHIKPE